MVDRGAESIIVGFPDPEDAPRFCGNVIDICPVGALTAQSYRFVMGRVWEQEKVPSVGSLDSLGSNIWLAGRLGDVARIIPRENPEVEDGLIDDVTRFSWESIEDPRRIKRAIVRDVDGETTVSRVSGEGLAAERLMAVIGEHGPDSVGMIAGAKLNNEEYLALKLFAGSVLNTKHYHLGDELFGEEGPDDAALAACLKHTASIEQIIHADNVLSLGCDLFDEAPSLGLRLDVAARRGRIKLLSARSCGSDADRHADEFAGYPWGELLRLVRGLTNALKGEGEVPEEAQAIAAKLKTVGEDCAILFGDEVWRDANPQELIHAIASLRDAIKKANPDAAVYLNPVYPSVNSVGALLMNHLHKFASDEPTRMKQPVGSIANVLQSVVEGKLKALVIIDADVLSTYPDRKLVEKALKAVDTVIYCGPFANPTSEAAGLHLPLGTYAHRDGTVLSMEWRMQRRARASIDSIAPSVMNVLDSIAVAADLDGLTMSEAQLYKKLADLVPGLQVDVPDEGALMKPENVPDAAAQGSSEIPPAVDVSVDQPVLVPKRFLYNDCEEIRYSPVFKGLALPFFAYINPDDPKAQGIASGDEIVIASGDAELKLKTKLARWVLPGSVVVNNYNIAQPANTLAGREPVRVSMKKTAVVREG
jgi:NADH-quinone oxidoreductase subunit G